MSDFNPEDIRNAGHDSIKILSETAHTFLDSFVSGFIPPNARNNTSNNSNTSNTGNTSGNRPPGFSGDLQKIPEYHISSNDQFFKYYFFMPGVSKENSNVKIMNGNLIVSGKTNFEANTITNIFYTRSVKLPLDIYSSDITATSSNGVFLISIPKKNENIDIVVN